MNRVTLAISLTFFGMCVWSLVISAQERLSTDHSHSSYPSDCTGTAPQICYHTHVISVDRPETGVECRRSPGCQHQHWYSELPARNPSPSEQETFGESQDEPPAKPPESIMETGTGSKCFTRDVAEDQMLMLESVIDDFDLCVWWAGNGETAKCHTVDKENTQELVERSSAGGVSPDSVTIERANRYDICVVQWRDHKPNSHWKLTSTDD